MPQEAFHDVQERAGPLLGRRAQSGRADRDTRSDAGAVLLRTGRTGRQADLILDSLSQPDISVHELQGFVIQLSI